MRLGIFAKTFAGDDPHAVMGAAAQAGYSALHYNMSCSGLPAMPEAIDEPTLAAIRHAAAACGMAVVGLSGTYNMAHPDRAVRAEGARRLRTVIAAAPAIGTRLVTLCTGSRDPDDQWRAHPDNAGADAWADMRAGLEDALAAAEAHGVDLGIEPELANVVCDGERAERLLDEMASDRLKIVLDPANLFEVADTAERRRLVEDAVGRLAPRIAMAHAKDRAADGAFVAAGTGVIDFRHFVACLAAAGFDGPLVAHGCTAEEAPGVARRLAPLVGER